MIGTTVSHYKILEKHGEGGMGVVYRARDQRLERDVALKFLPRNRVNDPELKARFEREAVAAAALKSSEHLYCLRGRRAKWRAFHLDGSRGWKNAFDDGRRRPSGD